MTEREIRDEVRSADRGGTGGQAPERPTQLPGGSWWAVIRRTVREFQDDNLERLGGGAHLLRRAVDLPGPAGAGVPARPGRAVDHADAAGQPRPGRARLGQPDPGRRHRATCARPAASAGLLAMVGLAVALWSASGYVAAFMRASNAIYDVPEGRPVWKMLPHPARGHRGRLVLLALSAVGGRGSPAAWPTQVGRLLGIGATAVTVWDIAKWPVLVLVVSLHVRAAVLGRPPTPSSRLPLDHPGRRSWPW